MDWGADEAKGGWGTSFSPYIYAARIFAPGEMASEITEIFYAFGPLLNKFMSVGICLSIFVVSCSSLSEVRQCRI